MIPALAAEPVSWHTEEGSPYHFTHSHLRESWTLVSLTQLSCQASNILDLVRIVLANGLGLSSGRILDLFDLARW